MRTDAVQMGVEFVEPLLFEKSKSGRKGFSAPVLDVEAIDPKTAFGDLFRQEETELPEISEPEIMRHFVRLSQMNFAIDKGMYPLGSCTMKYNPKVNEWAARLEGFAALHPYLPPEWFQGALELMWRLERGLAEVCGMDRVSLQPAAGAQGEFAGLMMIREHHRRVGRFPKKVLIPETAHGTNPASCALIGFEAVSFPAGEDGVVHLDQISHLINEDVAALMLTNPNTVGLFESELPKIAEAIHGVGGVVYGDGANLNALMGKVRPGDLGIDVMQFNLHKTFTTPHGGGGPGCGPVAYKRFLHPYAPSPVVERAEDGTWMLDENRPESVGRVRSFFGNFGMMVRAYTYLREMGAEGLRQATEYAVLNANYLRAKLSKDWDTPYPERCMHEVVISDKSLRDTGVTTMDIAKRLIDYGFHPPTVYFPLVIKGAMLIEPTETETVETLDSFVDALNSIAREAKEKVEVVKTAPQHTRMKRLDETRAARNPQLRF